MTSLTIEDISEKKITLRIKNTSKTFDINLNKKIEFSEINGLPKDQIISIGFISGKVAKNNYLICQSYDFTKIKVSGKFIIKEINFFRNIKFKHQNKVLCFDYKDFLGMTEIIDNISEEMCFYIGFLYGSFSSEEDKNHNPKIYFSIR
jgi:hypothetical protein